MSSTKTMPDEQSLQKLHPLPECYLPGYHPIELKAGLSFDMRDRYGKWCQATVISQTGKEFLIHYIGWESKWDQKIKAKKDAASIAKLSTYTAGHPRFYYRVGQTVLFYAARPEPRKWRLGCVDAVQDGHIRVFYGVGDDGKSFEVHSDVEHKQKYEHWISTATDEVFPFYPKSQSIKKEEGTNTPNASMIAIGAMSASVAGAVLSINDSQPA